MTGALHCFRPHQSRPQDLEAVLVGREPLLGEVLRRLGRWDPGSTRQHYLFIGPRGIGKTHLLCVIRHRILHDAALSVKWQPILLPEETYRVTGVADLVIEVLRFLHAETEDALIEQVLRDIEFEDDGARVIDRALDALRQYHRTSNKGIVLIIENLDRLLEGQIRQKSEIHLLRKILLEEEWLTLLCSSPTYLNAVADPDQPLFEFFHVKPLGELSQEEQREMFHKLAAWRGNEVFARYLDQYQSRLRALYHFTGGNPRLSVMLYELVGDHDISGVQTELSLLLDQITPFYQSRMKDVGEQAGKVLEAMALLPEGCTPTELARHARLEPATLRAQLARLEGAGYVRRGTRQKKQTTYMIPERLFRIWHQMNHSREAKGRVQYLLEFFTHWYATKGERDHAWEDLTREFEKGISGHDRERAHNSTELLEYLVEISDLDEKSSRKLDLLIHKAKHYPQELFEAAQARRAASEGQTKPGQAWDVDWQPFLPPDLPMKPGWSRAFRVLVKGLRHEASHVRGSAATALGELGSTEAVPHLLEALRDEAPDVRGSAATALGRIGSAESVPQLLEALRDQHAVVRGSAATALGRIGSAEAVPQLLEALRDQDRITRASAATALGRIGSAESVQQLLEALRNQDPNVRGSAATALGRIGSAESVPQLLDALRDQDSIVRGSAVKALGRTASPEAVRKLLEGLRDQDPFVRGAVAKALGRTGSGAAVPGLLDGLGDEDPRVRAGVATALGRIGSAAAVPRLLEALRDPERMVRGRTVTALGRIGSAAAVPQLLEALQDQDPIARASAATALGKMGSAAAVPQLLEALRDQDPIARANAATALGRIGSAAAVPQLIEALRDQYPGVRGSAATALGRIGSAESLRQLLEALRDEDPIVRGSAATALGRIGSLQGVPQLLEAMRDMAPNVRGSAAKALGRMGLPEAVPPLVEALRDKDAVVRVTVAAALGLISMARPVAEMDQVLEALLRDWRERSTGTKWRIVHSVLRSAFEFGDLDKVSRMLDFLFARLEDARRYCKPHLLAMEYLRNNRDAAILERQHPEMRDAIGLLIDVYDRNQGRALSTADQTVGHALRNGGG